MIEVKIIDAEHKADINIPNDPFRLFGRMVPSLQDHQWSYRVQYSEETEVTEMCFPDENYDYAAMQKTVFLSEHMTRERA